VNASAGGGLSGLPLTREPKLAADIETRLAALRVPLRERTPSDATFSNLLLFRDAHAYRFHPGPWPCIAGRSYDGAAIVVPLFDVASAPLPVLRDLQGHDAWFYPVADPVLARFDAELVEFRSLRDDADYLYAAAAFVDYDGPGLGAKRHAVERLLLSERIEVQPLDAANRDAALSVLDGWCQDKGFTATEADAPACREALETLAPGGALFGFLHRAGGVPAGFVLVEPLNPGVLAVRFAKGRIRFEGIFAYLFQDLVRRLGAGTLWLNFEQDLGKPNFRRTKLSFRPAALLAKHRVRVRLGQPPLPAQA
jgi:hypothetical protein